MKTVYYTIIMFLLKQIFAFISKWINERRVNIFLYFLFSLVLVTLLTAVCLSISFRNLHQSCVELANSNSLYGLIDRSCNCLLFCKIPKLFCFSNLCKMLHVLLLSVSYSLFVSTLSYLFNDWFCCFCCSFYILSLQHLMY